MGAALQRRLHGKGVTVSALHPGIVSQPTCTTICEVHWHEISMMHNTHTLRALTALSVYCNLHSMCLWELIMQGNVLIVWLLAILMFHAHITGCL